MSPNAVREGTLDVLIDPGFDDAAELSRKVILGVKMNRLIAVRNLSHACAAIASGIPPFNMAAIRNYGCELDDWLQAEADIDAAPLQQTSAEPQFTG